MDCPVCKDHPMITLELDDVETDYCQRCKGIWLDEGELEMLLDDEAAAVRLLDSFRTVETDEQKRKCPICGKKMAKIDVGAEDKTMIIDSCPKRHGLWFDAGELTAVMAIANFDASGKIVKLLNDIFSPEKKMDDNTRQIQTENFGEMPDGQTVTLYTLTNRNNLKACVTDYGATLVKLIVPDKDGSMRDIILGFDNLAGYLGGHPYIGSTAGRFANRIAGGKFTLESREYQLPVNQSPNHLHGGEKGFDKYLWAAETSSGPTHQSVTFSLISTDGDQGYPGRLDTEVTYTLNDENELVIEYAAQTDAATIVNLTNHSYFNLAGCDCGRDILGHFIRINADKYTPVNENLIPTGDIASVASSPLDLRKPVEVGSRIDSLDNGFDHNFVLPEQAGIKEAAELVCTETGIKMTVQTTQPGIQFYTGNFLDGTLTGKSGVTYQKHFGLCLETQHFPDSPNHPNFPTTVLKPDEKYDHKTIFKFETT